MMLRYIIFCICVVVMLYGNSRDIEQQLASIDVDEVLLINAIHKEQARVEKERVDHAVNEAKLQEERELEDAKMIESSLSSLKHTKERLKIVLRNKIEEAKRREKKARALALRRKQNHIVAHVDISSQKMQVYQGGKLLYNWLVSTARKGHSTPLGVYKPQYIQKMHYSKLYHNSPMPYTVFFRGNYAIHGTNSISKLGHKASHGCVRLHPKNAKVLYSMIKKFGKSNTEIKITN